MALAYNPLKYYTDAEIAELSRLNPHVRFERSAGGDLIVAPPTGGNTGRRNVALLAQLSAWNQKHRLGEVFDSSTGFGLPDGALFSPDASWVESRRWARLTDEQREKFPPLCPDVVFELTSPSDVPRVISDKLEMYLKNGAQLAVLINVEERIVELHRRNAVDRRSNPALVSLEPELPGFTLDLANILD
jgi:Uma2 family endonuclease